MTKTSVLFVFCVLVFGGHFRREMAAESSGSDSEFGGLIQQMVREQALGLGVDNQSDISVSSVHTGDLSDFSDNMSISSSSDDDRVDSEEEWTSDCSEKEIEDFVSPTGPKFALDFEAKPVDYFMQLFPESLFKKIRDETMIYARQQGKAFAITTAEVKAYLGVLFLMGVVQLPSYKHYWSSNPFLRQETIASVMPRNRYDEITQYIHLNDSTQNPPRGQPGHDKLHKVRPVLNNAKKQFPKHYNPHKNVAVDEAMVKYKGKCSFLQYMPAKPCKWGIKAWALADSESYYLVDFNIYTGKDTENVENIPLSTRVVVDLVKPLFKKRHHVYFDNFFTSVMLHELLLRKKTYACGTVRMNRHGLPVPMKICKLKNSGDMKRWQKGRVTAVTWCEKKRQVNVLSTTSSLGNKQITRKGKRGQPDVVYPKPLAIVDYCNNYNAVDKNDQLRSYYGIASKAKKWWKYLFWFICDVTMINAYILHKEAPGGPRPRPLTHLDFHIAVAKGLINGFSCR